MCAVIVSVVAGGSMVDFVVIVDVFPVMIVVNSVVAAPICPPVCTAVCPGAGADAGAAVCPDAGACADTGSGVTNIMGVAPAAVVISLVVDRDLCVIVVVCFLLVVGEGEAVVVVVEVEIICMHLQHNSKMM